MMKRRAPGSQVMTQTVWMLSLQNPKLGAFSGCGIRAAAKTPPHPAAPEPGKSSTRWTHSWSQRERARQGPAPLTEPWHHSDPTGMGAGSGLTAELLDPLLPAASRAAQQPWLFPVPWWWRSRSVGRFLQTHWDTWMWSASLAWDSSAPLGISAHQSPFPCAHSLITEVPHNCAPSPLLPACSSAWWGSAPSSCSTSQKGPSHPLVALGNPSAHSPGFHCPVLLSGGVSLHPFLFVPPQSLQCEGPVGVSWGPHMAGRG